MHFLCHQNIRKNIHKAMYAIRQILPPSVHQRSVILNVTNVDGVVEGVVCLVTQGVRVVAHLIDIDEPQTEPQQFALCVGSTVLAMEVCQHNSVFFVTEDLMFAVVRILLRHDEAGSYLTFEFVFSTPAPMESIANRPPVTDFPTVAVSPCGMLIAAQVYRGWIHHIDLNKAFANRPISETVSAVQLEKPNLKQIVFLATQNEPVVIPVYERPLTTLRGFFLNRSQGSLVDATRRWALGGLPYACWALSEQCVSSENSAFISESTTQLLFATQSTQGAGGVFRLQYSGLLQKRVTETVPCEIRCGVEVPTARGDTAMWLLLVNGDIVCSSLNRLLEAVFRDGDCDAGNTALPHIRFPALTAEDAPGRQWMYMRSSKTFSRRSRGSLAPLPHDLFFVALGDHMNVSIVDPIREVAVRRLSSFGPVVAICDGPRSEIITASSTGQLCSYQSRFVVDPIVTMEMSNVAALMPWQRVSVGSDSAVVVLASMWGDSTRAFILHPTEGLDEVHSGERSNVAPFIEDEATIVASFDGRFCAQVTKSTILATDISERSAPLSLHVSSLTTSGSFSHASFLRSWCVASVSRAMYLLSLEVSSQPIHVAQRTSVVTFESEISAIALIDERPTGDSTVLTVAVCLWNELKMRFVRVVVSPLTCGAALQVEELHSTAVNHMVRSIVRQDPVAKLWVTDVTGSVMTIQWNEQHALSNVPLEMVTVDRHRVSPSIGVVANDNVPCSITLSADVVVMSEEECVLFGSLAEPCNSPNNNVTAVVHLPLSEGNANTDSVRCGCAIRFTSNAGDSGKAVSSLFLLAADSTHVHILCSPDFSSWHQSPLASLQTTIKTTRATQMASIQTCDDSLISMLPLEEAHSLIVLSDSKRGSMLSVLDAYSFGAKEAMYLDESEFACGMEALPMSDDTVVIGTGLCKLPFPSDPTQGRVLVVAAHPLRIRARYSVEREGCHAIAPFVAPVGGENECFVAVGSASKLFVLRLLGDSLVQVATMSPTSTASAIAVSFPYISVSHITWGVEYVEFRIKEDHGDDADREAQQTRPPSKSPHKAPPLSTPHLQAASSPAMASTVVTRFSLVSRCAEAFANTQTLIDKSYSSNRFIRCCLRRNLNFVGLEEQSLANRDQLDDDGGAGLTSSPVIPVWISGVRVSGRPTCAYVTTRSHSAMRIPNGARCSSLNLFNFNTPYEPEFTVQSTAPRILIGCDDGSVYLTCGSPAELSRLLTRLEHSVVRFVNHKGVLQPSNRYSVPTNGAVPLKDCAFAGEPIREVFGAESDPRRVAWFGAAHRSLSSYEDVTAPRSTVRIALQHGFLDRSAMDYFLHHMTEAEQSELLQSDEFRQESSDTISLHAMRQVLVSMSLLE